MDLQKIATKIIKLKRPKKSKNKNGSKTFRIKIPQKKISKNEKKSAVHRFILKIVSYLSSSLIFSFLFLFSLTNFGTTMTKNFFLCFFLGTCKVPQTFVPRASQTKPKATISRIDVLTTIFPYFCTAVSFDVLLHYQFHKKFYKQQQKCITIQQQTLTKNRI